MRFPAARLRSWVWFGSAVLVLVMCAGVWQWQRSHHAPRRVHSADLGEVHDYPAWWWQRGIVVLWSGARGWQRAEQVTAQALAQRGLRVLGVDTRQWLQVHANDHDCLYLPGMIEAFSRDQQRLAGTTLYQLPWLLGHAEGGALVWLAQMQAPPLSFSGVVAIDPQPALPRPATFCAQPVSAADQRGLDANQPDAHQIDARRFDAQGAAPRPLPALQLTDTETSVPLRVMFNAQAQPAAATFHWQTSTTPMALNANESMLNAFIRARASVTQDAANSPVADLPLVELPARQSAGDVFTILYSGDGGWRDLDQNLGEVLAAQGMPVVGVDTLAYYWHEVSPEQSAKDLARLIRYYQQHWHRHNVLLVGFSFGANVLPFLYHRLPPDLQASVLRVSLLSPERRTAFAVNPAAWLHLDSAAGKVPIAPELPHIPATRLQCMYGEQEAADSLCTQPELRPEQVLRKSGGHHFDENYPVLAHEVLAGLPTPSQ